jgi:hypothetical protein
MILLKIFNFNNMKYIYALLIIIVLYYLFSNLYQNYSSSEHFDPSLVPVSSIITLAKVAQKFVDGGGTLTNPGNLNLGIPSAPGNLTVTGNTSLGAPTSSNKVYGNLNVGGNITLGGTSDGSGFTLVKEQSNFACLRQPGSVPNSANGNRLCFSQDHGIVNFYGDGSLQLAGKLNVPGDIIGGGKIRSKGASSTPNNGNKGDGFTHFPNEDGNNYIRGNTIVNGGLTVTDTIKSNYNGSGGSWDQQFDAAIVTSSGVSIGTNGSRNIITSDKDLLFEAKNLGNGNTQNTFTFNNLVNFNRGIGGNVAISNDLATGGKLCVGSTCMSQHTLNTFLFPPVQLVRNTSGYTLDWAKSVVDDIYPVMFIDNWITETNSGASAGYMFRSGLEIPNLADAQYHNMYQTYQQKFTGLNFGVLGASLDWDYTSNTRFNFVVVAPGYATSAWTDVNYNNRAETTKQSVNPFTVENRTSSAVIRRLDKDPNADVTNEDNNGNNLTNGNNIYWG